MSVRALEIVYSTDFQVMHTCCITDLLCLQCISQYKWESHPQCMEFRYCMFLKIRPCIFIIDRAEVFDTEF